MFPKLATPGIYSNFALHTPAAGYISAREQDALIEHVIRSTPMSFHTLILVGNVGRDPEMRYTPSGQPVTNFSVASNRQYTGNNGQVVKETLWFRITTWGKQAEVCYRYLKKGSKVLVEGRLTADPATGGPRVYDKQDGSFGASFEVTASAVRFLSSHEGGGNRNGDSHESEAASFGAPDDDDLPF